LKTHVQEGSIKFNLKLEATHNRPNVPNSSENRAFKTSAVEVFEDSNIIELVERACVKLMAEEETYKSRGSGFTLETIDGLLLAVYEYRPISGSSYIELPTFIDRKRSTTHKIQISNASSGRFSRGMYRVKINLELMKITLNTRINIILKVYSFLPHCPIYINSKKITTTPQSMYTV